MNKSEIFAGDQGNSTSGVKRQSSLGLLDPSALPLTDLTVDELNPLERQRIRELIRRYGGDSSLLPLADEELDCLFR